MRQPRAREYTGHALERGLCHTCRWLSFLISAAASPFAACGGLTDDSAAGAPGSGGAATGGRGVAAGGAGAGGTAAPGCSGPPWVSAGQASETGSEPRSVVGGDFDLDGKQDLAVANHGSGTVSVLLGDGDGTFAWRVHYEVGFQPVSVAVADSNLDTELDLAVANHGLYTVSVLLGRGDGTFGARVDYGTSWGPSDVGVGDFNLDGTPDLAVAYQASGVLGVNVLLGNGDGTFAGAMDSQRTQRPHSVAGGGFNLDGKPDLALANTASVSVLLGNGDGTFADSTDSTARHPPATRAR